MFPRAHMRRQADPREEDSVNVEDCYVNRPAKRGRGQGRGMTKGRGKRAPDQPAESEAEGKGSSILRTSILIVLTSECNCDDRSLVQHKPCMVRSRVCNHAPGGPLIRAPGTWGSKLNALILL